MTLLLAPAAKAQYTESVLYSFTASGPNSPYAGVIFDSHGNLYGTTEKVGSQGGDVPGAAFELSPPSGGSGPWTETTIASLCCNTSPAGSLAFDSHDNLYGTNQQGGYCGYGGYGNVFELSPPSSGTGSWNETTIYYSCAFPAAGVIFDSSGNLYGTEAYGGIYGAGDVFELSPPSSGTGPWTYHVLHSFCSYINCADGAVPGDRLIFDSSGNLWGTTGTGGDSPFCPYQSGCGVVFKLTPNGDGKWSEDNWYNFCQTANCPDGDSPEAGVILDSHGDPYGITPFGGNTPGCGYNGCGVVFELNTGSIPWKASVLHSFTGGTDGAGGFGGVILDSQGNLYGTTWGGGESEKGDVFELSPPSSGSGPWTETVLYSFMGGSDGGRPADGLIFDSKGNLYGTAAGGGTGDGGVVFELKPPQLEITASTSSISIMAGGQGTVQLTVNVSAGTPGAASLACTGLPPGASCSFSPSSVTAYPTTVNLTISTAAGDARLRRSHPSLWAALALMLPGLLLLPAGRGRRRAVGFLAGVVLLLIFSLAGCGSSGSGGGGGSSYSVVVTGSATGAANGTATIDITVTN